MGVQKECATDLDITPKNDVRKHRLKQRFDVRQKLGQGTYGKVQLAVNKDSGQEVAIKTIKKSKIESEQDLIRIRREIQIMSSIQHPHIIHIYEVFENKDKIVLVMQFASGGELYDYLSEKKVLSDLEARRIFRQIAAAVYYCHKNKICHRDLKLENILLDEKGNAKIADFGLSNVFDERHLLKTYCGSPLYASPEIVKGVPYYGPEVDCWSMGVLLYTLVYGAMPFDGSNFKKLVTQISEGDYFEPKKKSKASDLIHKLLTVSPLKRATIVDICTDQWVNQGYEHSLLQVAEDMANLTPVRLDLLLALAPASPIPTTDDDDFREEESKDTFENDAIQKSNAAAEDDEDEEEEDEDNAETATNSFAFVRASQASNLCGSTRDIQQSAFPDDYEGQDEFLPVDVIAALENHCTKRGPEQSFDGSISRVSSMAHKSKKPRKSDSMLKNKEAISALSETSEENNKNLQKVTKVPSKKNIQVSLKTNDSSIKNSSQEKSQSQSPIFSTQTRKSISKGDKLEDIGNANTENLCDALHAQTDSENQEKLKPETKRRGRSPGKIIIPKTFESPQSTPSPKAQLGKSPPTTPPAAETGMKKSEKSEGNRSTSSINQSEDANNTVDAKGVRSDSSSDAVSKSELVSEEKKQFAKGILKKGIAKAKLAERRLSQQSSTETEVATPPPIHPTAEVTPSFFKAPTPYIKEEEEKHVQSKAQIILSPPTKPPDTTKSNNTDSKTPLWDSAIIPTNKQSRNLSWGTVDSTIDSDMNNWREQMEESLRRLSPENDRERSITSSKPEEDEHLVPIARSYKKFTFTKDGACITETKKIYTTPGADGSWTKVEKKTRITTRPGNAEEFEKLRDLHLRNDSPLTKSDSQSSTGSTEVYDDIFDSWTGDTMMCNMMKIKNMFQKFSRDPFLRTERRRNPFRNFRRTESDRNERSRRRPELRSGQSTDKDSSDNEEDYEVSFDSSNPVVYGSQGLWQFLRSSNKRMPRRVTMVEPEQHSAYTRSVSQDRSEAKHNSWKRTESRASSGYNTGSRSQSRDRTQSPHEKVLRFVFESPSQMYARSSSPTRNESWCFKKTGARHNPRRDSGVGSDGYESEHSYKRVPSDDLSKSGRISPVYNSSKQGLIHDFVKSWPKEMASQHEASSGFTDTRRHKVEQWLHMNDMNEENFPFGFQSEPKMSTRKANIHDNLSSTYATMRPREFMKYSRSSSDKVSDSNADYFSSFDEGPRCSRSSQIEAVRNRFRNAAYSPVSEESRETHSLHHSDSSHSSSSVHRINFTISDGRVSTSLTSSPQSGSRQAQSFVLSPGEHVIESNTRNAGPPVVQMRVSFNHGNRENKVLNITSQAPPVSSGLWQQQESPRNTSQTCNIVKETSPVPGIKKFSTEMVHKVGNNGDNQQSADNNKVRHHSNNTSIECEVKTSLKNTPKG